MGWRSSKDYPLLALAEKSFDVFITVDKRLALQQNLSHYRLGVIIIKVPNNRLESFLPIVDDLTAAMEQIRPTQVIEIWR